jgi:hypothetical protein
MEGRRIARVALEKSSMNGKEAAEA